MLKKSKRTLLLSGIKGRRCKPLIRLGSYKPMTFRSWVVDVPSLMFDKVLYYIMYDKFIWNFYVKFLCLIPEKYYNKIIFKRLVCRFIGFTSNTEEWFLACLILYVYIYISYVLAGWCMRELYAKLIFFLKRVKNALKNRFECIEHLC